MFEIFRKGVASWFAMILLGLLIASFALWGIGDPLSTLGSGAVVEVADEKVTPTDFARAFDRDFAREQQRFGDSITKELAIQVGFANRTLRGLAEMKAYDVEAKKLGIRSDTNSLREYIYSIPNFQNEDGTFNRNYFDQFAAMQGLGPKDFEQLLSDEIVRFDMIETIFGNVKASNISTETLTKYVTEQRVAEILNVRASGMTGFGEATDEDIKKFYDENPNQFMAPEYRDISFFEISVSEIQDNIEVSEDEMVAAYENRVAEFTNEEARGFVQMLLDDEETADIAYADLQAGKSFAEVILDRTGETEEDSLFDPTEREEIIDVYGDDVADAIYETAVNGYTAPIESALGYYIFKVTEITEGSTRPFDDVREELVSDIKANRALDALYEMQNSIDDELAAGASISEIADAIAVDLKSIKNVSSSGLHPDGTAESNLPLIVDFLDKSFAANIGDDLILEEAIGNKFYMLNVDNIIDSRQKDLEEVRSDVVLGWEQMRREELATEMAQKIKADYDASENADKSLADFQEASSMLIYNEVTTTRVNQDNAVSGNIHTSIFNQDEGSVELINAANGDGFVLVRVKERVLSSDASEEDLAETRSQISRSYQSDIMRVHMESLFKTLPVTINQSVADATLQQIANPELP